jgi:raffinose/stachyose/melibiose transport system permease protein
MERMNPMKWYKSSNSQVRQLEPRNQLIKALNFLLLVAIILIIFVPLYIVFTMSFKTDNEYITKSIFSLPSNFFNFKNYFTVFEQSKLIIGFKNVALLCLVSVTGSVIMGLMVSYVLTRFEFRFKKIISFLFLLSAIIPSLTVQVALFHVIKSLHIFNTIYSCMLLYMATDIVQIYIFIQFINKIPYELDESAIIDGASYFRTFRSIIIPQMKPAIATVVILKVLEIYNDMYRPYLYMPKTDLRTVTTCILTFSYDRFSSWTLMSAGIVAVMLPTIIMYLFFQRYIISGVTDGSVKL